MHGLPKSVCVVPVLTVSVQLLIPYVFVCRKFSLHLGV